MHLGSIYLVVNDYDQSIYFYEKLLQIPVTRQNTNRFAMFEFKGKCISLMNGHFDVEHPDKVIRKGDYTEEFDNFEKIALSPNTHKFVLNFWTEDLQKEYERIKSMNISNHLTGIKYVCHVSPYYYFQFTDPDDNVIEVTGDYVPEKMEGIQI